MKIPFRSHTKSKETKPQPADNATSLLENVSADSETICGLSDLYVPEENLGSHVRDVADVLLEAKKITTNQHAKIRSQQSADPGTDAANLLLKAQFCGPDDVLMAKAELCGLEFRNIQPQHVQKEAFEKLDAEFMKTCSVCPVAIEDNILVVATSEPANMFAFEDIKRKTQMDLRVVVCTQQDIDNVCAKVQHQATDYNLDDIISDMTEVEIVQDQQDSAEDLEKMAGQSPVIKFVNYLISNAIREGASDIHIEPKDKFTKIRYRIDGSREVDLRVSTLPTNHGEKVVIRVLDSKSTIRGLEKLGMQPEILEDFRKQIVLPHGILLVTGPTGSGKSTTLYSSLGQMDGEKLNISTVEDPVEYQLDFCNQVQVHDKIGLTFATALRSLLRQDPDVIMIGEIRDNETARIAVQAALTGHLVFSTLHTNDAASSVTRLVNIGIEPYLIAASLNGILAQRLVRKICTKCKKQHKVPAGMRKYAERAGVKPSELYHGRGCDKCRGSGYSGRIGIYEFLVINEEFRDMINKDSSVNNMRRAFHKTGQPTLFVDGIKKVKNGLTTIAEVLRVTEVYGQNENEVFVENVK